MQIQRLSLVDLKLPECFPCTWCLCSTMQPKKSTIKGLVQHQARLGQGFPDMLGYFLVCELERQGRGSFSAFSLAFSFSLLSSSSSESLSLLSAFFFFLSCTRQCGFNGAPVNLAGAIATLICCAASLFASLRTSNVWKTLANCSPKWRNDCNDTNTMHNRPEHESLPHHVCL